MLKSTHTGNQAGFNVDTITLHAALCPVVKAQRTWARTNTLSQLYLSDTEGVCLLSPWITLAPLFLCVCTSEILQCTAMCTSLVTVLHCTSKPRCMTALLKKKSTDERACESALMWQQLEALMRKLVLFRIACHK